MSNANSNLPLWLAFIALVEQATRDGLTRLYNRRFFEETLADHIEAADRYGRELALVLFDIDRLKQINDNLGHEAGDKVLQQFASLLKTSARKADIICRIGGDEFAVLLPETGISNAGNFVERVLKTLSDSKNFGFSATFGIAALPCKELYATADAELLARKRESR